jgi:hypothetical protein
MAAQPSREPSVRCAQCAASVAPREVEAAIAAAGGASALNEYLLFHGAEGREGSAAVGRAAEPWAMRRGAGRGSRGSRAVAAPLWAVHWWAARRSAAMRGKRVVRVVWRLRAAGTSNSIIEQVCLDEGFDIRVSNR